MNKPLLALVVAFLASAMAGRFSRFESRNEPGRSTRGLLSALLGAGVDAGPPVVPPLFTFAPDGGAGLPVAQTLCSQLTADELDGGWCLNGDGTSMDGGYALTDVGTVEDATRMTCPNGPNCGALAVQVHDVNEGAYTASRATGTGSVTLCWLGSVDLGGASIYLVTQATAYNTAGISALLELGITGTRFYASDGANLATSTSGTAVVGARHLYCGTWSGASGAIAYLDGTAGSPAALATRQSITTRDMVHGINETASGGGGNIIQTEGAFRINAELSSARIAEIARAVLADQPKASLRDGGTPAMTFSRTTQKFCDENGNNMGDTDGISRLPPNRPCITRGGILVEGAVTNRVQYSEGLNNWSRLNVGATTPTVTTDYAIAPTGEKFAERFVISACPDANDASFVRATFTSRNGPFTYSMYVRGTSGSGSIRLWTYHASDADGRVAALCNYTSTSWTRCSVSTPSGGPVDEVAFGCTNSSAVANSGNTGAADILAYGAQAQDGPYATSVVLTTTVAAMSGADVATFDLGAGMPGGNAISVAGTLDNKPAATNDTYSAIVNLASDSMGGTTGKGMWLYSNNSNGVNMRCAALNDAASPLAVTGDVAVSSGTVRGRCNAGLDGGTNLDGEFAGSSVAPFTGITGTYSPARYLTLGGQTQAAIDTIKRDICIDDRECAP